MTPLEGDEKGTKSDRENITSGKTIQGGGRLRRIKENIVKKGVPLERQA